MSSIIDPFFGEMNSSYDKLTETFFLDKEIKIGAEEGLVVLSIESNTEGCSEKQLALFKEIEKDFSNIWEAVLSFLVIEKKYTTASILQRDFKIESISLSNGFDENQWELDLLNVKDGFSHILVELEGDKPINFSVEA